MHSNRTLGQRCRYRSNWKRSEGHAREGSAAPLKLLSHMSQRFIFTSTINTRTAGSRAFKMISCSQVLCPLQPCWYCTRIKGPAKPMACLQGLCYSGQNKCERRQLLATPGCVFGGSNHFQTSAGSAVSRVATLFLCYLDASV